MNRVLWLQWDFRLIRSRYEFWSFGHHTPIPFHVHRECFTGFLFMWNWLTSFSIEGLQEMRFSWGKPERWGSPSPWISQWLFLFFCACILAISKVIVARHLWLFGMSFSTDLHSMPEWPFLFEDACGVRQAPCEFLPVGASNNSRSWDQVSPLFNHWYLVCLFFLSRHQKFIIKSTSSLYIYTTDSRNIFFDSYRSTAGSFWRLLWGLWILMLFAETRWTLSFLFFES